MTARLNRSARAGIVALAVSTAALVGAGPATAEPETPTDPAATAPAATAPAATPPAAAPPATAEPGQATTVPTIPGDAELAALLRKLKADGGAEKAVAAITAILASDGRLDPAEYLGDQGILDSVGLSQTVVDQLGLNRLGLDSLGPGAAPTHPAPAVPAPTHASADVLGVLQKATGTNLLTPAIAPLCTESTPDNPLGLATAPAMAVPGPWPTLSARAPSALSALIPADSKDLLTAIGENQTAFALVPPGTPESDQFRVAWFNTSTLRGGLADLKPLSAIASPGPLKQLLAGTENFHGVRLARVDTGKGTILSAVFGSTTDAGRTCYFLPALGTVKN